MMAKQQVGSFFLTPDQIDQLTTGGSGITIEINYYDDDPAGYEVVAKSTDTSGSDETIADVEMNALDNEDLAASVQIDLCGRPCTKLVFPTEP